MAQEMDSAIDQLIKDLNEFKQAVRIGEEDGQNNALGLLDKVIASDRHLQQSFSKYAEHKQLLKNVQEKEQRLMQLDKKIGAFGRNVYEQICSIESAIDADNELLEKLNLQLKNFDHVDKQTVLQVAKQLSYTKGPSSMWGPGQSLGNHRPPYPTEDLMRCSLLFQRMNLGKGHDAEKPATDASQKLIQHNGHGHSMSSQQQMMSMPENDFDLLGLDLNPDLI